MVGRKRDATKTYFTFPPVEDAALSKITLAVRVYEADKNKFLLVCDIIHHGA
jgi:hypothetical protein